MPMDATPPPGVDPAIYAGAAFENTITEAIAAAMDTQNVSQEQLAERMGRAPRTIRCLLGGYQSYIADYGEALHVLGLRVTITIEPMEKPS